MWRPPVGYIAVRERGRRNLAIDPERAPLVRRAFELIASGLYDQAGVLKIVSEMGLLTKRGEAVAPQTFWRLLRIPLYAGRVVVPAWGIDVLAAFPAIVEPEIWWRVQSRLDASGLCMAPPQRNRPDFPLRAFVCCAACGRKLTGSWSKGRSSRHAYYHCPGAARCKTRVPVSVLEKDWVAMLGEMRPAEDMLRLFRAVAIDEWRSEERDTTARRQGLERKVSDLKDRKRKLVEAFVYRQAIDEATYQAETARIAEDLAAAEMALHDARLEEIDAEAAVDFAITLVSKADRMWILGNLEQRQRLQAVLYPDGVLCREGRIVRTVSEPLNIMDLQPLEGGESRWGLSTKDDLGERAVRTDVNPLEVNDLEGLLEGGSQMVSPTGLEPVFLP